MLPQNACNASEAFKLLSLLQDKMSLPLALTNLDSDAAESAQAQAATPEPR